MNLDFEALFEDSPVPSMVLDREFRFAAANAAYLDMVGKSREELIGQYVFDAFPEEADRVDAMQDVFRRALAGERPVFEDVPFAIEKDGVVTEHWWTAHHAPITGPSGEINYMVQYSEDVTAKVKLAEMRRAVMGEMHHRIGNLFTIVGSMARQIARRADGVPDFMQQFERQMSGFFRVQKDLSLESEEGRDIADVIDEQLSAYFAHAEDRIRTEGPPLILSPSEAKAVSMAIHELSVNSLKYGAIRTPDARLDVRWSPTETGGVHLIWQEDGLRTSAVPGREGYGTHLLTRILPEQVQGSGIRVMDDRSLRYDLTINRG